MGVIDYKYKNKEKYALLIISISMLIFGVILFCEMVSKNKPAVKQHRAIYKYMGEKYFEESSDTSPDFGDISFLKTAMYPRFSSPKVAADIGITILSSLYGEEMADLQKPYSISLINDEVWEIRGCIPYKDFYIMIQSSDYRVLFIGGYSYMDYITGAGIYSKEKIDMTDFINNLGRRPHPFLTYKYQGERYGEKLPFVRLPLPSFVKKDFATPKWMSDNGYTPDSNVRNLPDGVLKDYETAAKVGMIILSSVHGENDLIPEKPFDVWLCNNKRWRLQGNLPKKYESGGAATINIQKSDCRIINLYHEKN